MSVEGRRRAHPGEVDSLGNPVLHEQVQTTYGFFVDEEIWELIETLWAGSFYAQTAYSCQGGRDVTPQFPYIPAYIGFPDQGAAERFRRESIHRGAPEDCIDVHLAGLWMARWDPKDTEMITKIWRDKAK